MLVNCMMCRKEFDINHSDPQFRKFIEKQTKYYICLPCNSNTKKEAISLTGINPDSLDPHGYDKLLT